MNVTLIAKRSHAVTALALAACLTGGAIHAETHSNLQAVTGTGTSAWCGSAPFTLTGVLVTDPTEMLDPAPNFIPWNGGAGQYQLGAQWQIVFQAVEPGDRGGTACYIGQCRWWLTGKPQCSFRRPRTRSSITGSGRRTEGWVRPGGAAEGRIVRRSGSGYELA